MKEDKMPITKTSNYDIFYIDEGDGIPLFFIHGLAGDHRAWLNQITYFKSKYRVIAIDNPGSGDSSPVTKPCSTQDLANTMLEVIENLAINEAHIVGRSLGGFISQQMAKSRPDVVKSLVISTSAAKVTNNGKRTKFTIARSRGEPLILFDDNITKLPENIVLGLRPEDIGDANLRKGDKLQISTCSVDVVEPAGADTYVLINLGGKEVTARLQAETAAQTGMEMAFTFNMDKVTYFDAKTGQRLN